VLAVYLALFGFLFTYPSFRDNPPTVCVFRAVTGVPCPTCGGMRATVALAFGNLSLAFRYNPLVTAAWLLLPPTLLLTLVRRKRPFPIGGTTKLWLVRLAVILVALAGIANWHYVIRNLPQLEQQNGRALPHLAANAHPDRDSIP